MISIELARRLTLFAGLDEETLRKIASTMYLKSFNRLEYVIRRGEPGSDLLFLVQGHLQVIDHTQIGRELGIAFIREGDFFGELSVIDGAPRSASVVAVQPSTVATLPGREARNFFYENSTGSERVIRELAYRLRQTTSARASFSAGNAAQRVVTVLSSIGVKRPDGSLVVERLPTQSQVASMANLARETVARVMNDLKRQGLIRGTGVPKQIVVIRKNVAKNNSDLK